MYHRGKYQCNNKHTTNCYRREILGVQYTHISFFIFLGKRTKLQEKERHKLTFKNNELA